MTARIGGVDINARVEQARERCRVVGFGRRPKVGRGEHGLLVRIPFRSSCVFHVQSFARRTVFAQYIVANSAIGSAYSSGLALVTRSTMPRIASASGRKASAKGAVLRHPRTSVRDGPRAPNGR